MQKVKFNPFGLNTIQIAGRVILVNGYPAATTFNDFKRWFKTNNLDVAQFANWPFVEGISECIDPFYGINDHLNF